MSATDFLFNGKPPSNINATTVTQTNMPDWYQSYTQGLLGKSNALAATPYQARPAGVGGVAPVTQQQKDAWSMTSKNVGDYQPYYDQANTNFGQSMNYINQGVGNLNSVNGMLNSGQGYVGQGIDQLNPASQDVNAGMQMTGQGYQGAADVAGLGGGVNNGAFSSYMNPYNTNVTNAIANLGQRNLTQNLLPQVNDTFIGAGQFGSNRNSDFTQRAVQNANESILNQQAQALQSGYNSSMANYLQGQGQQLQAGQQMTQAGQAAGALGQAQTGIAGQAMNAGQVMGALGQAGTGAANSAIAGGQAAAATGVDQTALGTAKQNAGIKDAAALEAAGQAQQAQQQNIQNQSLTDWTNQTQWPFQMAQFMNQQIRGFNPPTTSSTSTNAPVAGSSGTPSGLAQLGQAISTGGALSKMFGG